MKKILSVVLAAVILIAYLAPISPTDAQANAAENPSFYAAQFVETTNGVIIEDATLEDGKATFTVTTPAGGCVQFMQKVSISGDKDSTLQASVTPADNTEKHYQNMDMYMQLTASDDVSKDIVPIKESDTNLPGTDGMTWRFYGAPTVLWFGRGANTSNPYDANIATVIDKGVGASFVFTKTDSGTVLPTAPQVNGGAIAEWPSYKTLTAIGGGDGVYFRLRSEVEQTYTVVLRSPDIKNNSAEETNGRYLNNFISENETDENIKLSGGSYLENSIIADGEATFKVKLAANGGYAQFNQKLTDLIGGTGSVKVTIGEDADINDYYNASFYIQLTAKDTADDIVPVTDSASAPNTDAISFRLFGYNNQYLMFTTNTTSGSGAKYYTSRLGTHPTDVTNGMTFIFPENADDSNKVQIRSQRSDLINAGVAGIYTSNQTVADINGQEGVYVRLRNNRDVDVTYTFTIKSNDIKAPEVEKDPLEDLIITSENAVVDYDASSVVDGEATYKVTLPANGGYAQFNQKLTDLIGGTGSVKVTIGENSDISDYYNAHFYLQLTADATGNDIVPVTDSASAPNTDAISFRLFGYNNQYLMFTTNTTSGSGAKYYTSRLGTHPTDVTNGMTFIFPENADDSNKVQIRSQRSDLINAGVAGIYTSNQTAANINGQEGVYVRLRNNRDVEVTYTFTIKSNDIKAPEEEILLEDLIAASENSVVDRSTVSVVDGEATFKVTLPANGGYAQFNQKLTDLIGGTGSVKVTIGEDADINDYYNASFYIQLTAKDTADDIVPVDDSASAPNTDALSFRLFGYNNQYLMFTTKTSSGTGAKYYTSRLGTHPTDVTNGMTFIFPENAEDSNKVQIRSQRSDLINAGVAGIYTSNQTAADINGQDGVYVRIRNNRDVEVTYTLTIASDDIKGVIIKEPIVEEPIVEEDRYSFSDNESYLISSNHTVENGVVTDTFTFKLNGNGSNIQLEEKLSTLIDGGFAKVYLGDNTSADYAKTNFNMQLTSKPDELFIEPVNELTQPSDATAISFIFGISSGNILSVNRGNGFGGSAPYIPNYENTPGVDGINVYFKTNETGTIDITRVKALNGYDFKKTSTHNVIDAGLTDGAYFRIRHNGDAPQVYTVVLTYPESNVKHDLSDKAYTVTGASVVNADNAQEVYTTGNTITKAGHYIETSNVNGGTVTKNIYLYKTGDINGDGNANILDLMVSTSFVRYSDLSYMQSLGIKAIDEFNSYNVFPKLKRELLGLDYEVVEYNGSEPVTLKVEDFGAVGDGKTDDAVAIYDAVQALRQCAPGSVLQFEAKTYRFVDNGTYSQITNNGFRPTQAVFELYGDKGLTIRGKTEGNNTTLISIGGKELNDGSHYCKNYYANIENCEDVAIENINFDYAEYKPAFAVTDIDYRDGWLSAYFNGTKNILTGTLVKDANGNYPDIHLENGESYTANGNATFGVLNKESSRYHMYFTSFKMVDKATGKIEITLNKDHDNTMNNLGSSFFSGISDFILPMPYSGNLIQRGFTIHEVNNFRMENCKVFSASRHGMSLQHNTGDITFNNVDVVPSDSNLNFTSWGDFYHVIHSTGANYTWNNCEAKYNYDDVFNISAATLVLNKVNTLRDIEIGVGTNGFGRVYAGTTLVIVDSATGELVYRDTIKRVIEQDSKSANIRLSSSLPAGTTIDNKYVWIEEAAGISTMTNCTFDGTFRARANITFNSCDFTVKRFWIGLESADREGPLSRNVIFNNCSLTCQGNSVFEIGSHNTGTNAKSDTAYKLENIKFSGCTWKNSSGKVTSYSSFIAMQGNSADEVIHN